MKYKISSKEDLDSFIENHKDWRIDEDRLIGEFTCQDFEQVKKLVHAVIDLADELDHHPTVEFSYRTFTIVTNTHDAGNKITSLDLDFAKRITQLIRE